MAVRIELNLCINCGLCRKACPTETILFFTTGHRTHVVEPAGCIDCDICVPVCPEHCIVPDEAYVHDPIELAEAKQRAKEWNARRRATQQRVRDRANAAIATLAARNG